ncbi:DUF2247 domain-containing protein, partial [Neisseria gonorrhoeae]
EENISRLYFNWGKYLSNKSRSG